MALHLIMPRCAVWLTMNAARRRRRASISWRDIYICICIYPPDIFRIYKYSRRYLYIRGTPCRATTFPFRIVLFGNLARGRHLQCRRRFSGIPAHSFQHGTWYRTNKKRDSPSIVDIVEKNRFRFNPSALSPAVWPDRIFSLRNDYTTLQIYLCLIYVFV